jgi:formylglycine-generating enzyme required for sulfatase activity
MISPLLLLSIVAQVGSFRDCAECPAMVIVPAGTFTMGSSAQEKSWAASHGATMGSVADEAPQHTVTLRAFALGQFDVTRDEYAAFMRETNMQTIHGCAHDSFKWNLDTALSWKNPGFSQSPRDPVVCVSWHDAQVYVAWLNHKVGSGAYRLPSEAEWEYAARGGTRSMFWWGDDTSGAVGHAWFKSNSGGSTRPVGSQPANPFGLSDIVGDVWQWTADCYAESYANAPADGRPAEEPIGCMRVDRGGTWLFPAWFLRPATRERNPPEFRDPIMGFRVAKTLPQ